MAMTVRELELQKRAKADEARRIARLQAQANQGPQSPLRQTPIAPQPTPQSVRTPEAVDGRLRTRDIAAYRAAGNVLSDPNRTVEDVQRAVADRVRLGNQIRGSSDFELYREGLRRPTATPPSYAGTELQPNIATPEEVAAGTRAPAKPPEKSAWRQLADTGVDMLRNFPAFMRDAYEANDPGYFTEPVKRWMTQPGTIGGAIAEFDRNTPAPSLMQAAIKAGRDQAEYVTKPTLRRWGNAVDNYINPSYDNLNMSGNGTSATASALGDQINQGLRNAPVGSVASPAASSRQIYQTGPNSFTDNPNAPGAEPYTPSAFADSAGVGGVGGVGNAGLRRSQSSFEYGPRQPDGRRTMTINRSNPYAGMSDAQIAPIAAQKRAELNARRMAGAAYGGNILRDINRINRQAQKAYDESINAGMNVNVARDRANIIRGQAEDLVDFDRTQSYREGQRLDSDLAYDRLAADQEYRMAAQMAGLTKEQQAAVRDDVERIALGLVDPKSENSDVEAARYANLVTANLPRNIDQLNARERNEALQQAAADARFVSAVNELNPSFSFLSRSEMLQGLQNLDTRDFSFFSGMFRDGPIDALISEIMGHREARIPGTDEYFTVQRLEELREQSRRGKRDLLRDR